jgi:nucleoside-diphosphate-sugar epimerase
MMYIPDAIRAAIELMEADSDALTVRSSYNIGAMSFSPGDIAAEIKKHICDFTISYKPDSRQHIADSWPKSIDDTDAKRDWGWKPDYDIERMTTDMLKNLQQ